ncbi:hypothetical protein [Chitinophaga varians]|uniref:hypothetical protein n=1 Tax=Chitinophaga varians TaxID=2202339 RepID=UPI00165EC8F7|nr:hypothetical protein [Chitinophaga varians]MBC9913176.1 hypothetical protein [Chitinophaga varians]
MIKALALYQDGSGCDYHRLVLPFQYEDGYIDHEYKNRSDFDMDTQLAASELVVWNRDCPIGLSYITELKARYGFKVVVDLDDHWELYPHHYLYNRYQRQRIPELIIKNLQLADAITVTTSRLADKVKPINPNVHVIPNALPYGFGQFQAKRVPADIFRFIYAGQRSHLHDLKQLQGPLRRIASEQHRNMGFTLAGYNHHSEDRTSTWPKMEQIFSAGGAMIGYQRVENKPLGEYMTVYENSDACLVPLEGNAFNAHKSNLKLLEAGAKTLPVICQKVPPYSDCDAPVLWVERQTDWYKHIRYLAANRSAAEDLGLQLHDWAVSNYNIFDHNKTRFELYTHIINS